jgi:hypothetical protein
MMRKRSSGTMAVIAALLGMLGFAVYVMVAEWNVGDESQGSPISTSGYFAMGIGIFFTLALGVGLMTLIFYSNRSGRN